MSRDYQLRDKFFYVSPKLFSSWPFKSRMAIGMKFEDFLAIDDPVYRFKIKGKMYEVDKKIAMLYGNRYKVKGGSLPNLIPLEVFKVYEV